MIRTIFLKVLLLLVFPLNAAAQMGLPKGEWEGLTLAGANSSYERLIINEDYSGVFFTSFSGNDSDALKYTFTQDSIIDHGGFFSIQLTKTASKKMHSEDNQYRKQKLIVAEKLSSAHDTLSVWFIINNEGSFFTFPKELLRNDRFNISA